MKLDRRHIVFLSPFFSRRTHVVLYGKGNTMQLLETALVIEGYRQRLFFPLIDRFIKLALSEWTTITVPYSRILRCKYNRKLWLRVPVLLLGCLPAMVWLMDLLRGETNGPFPDVASAVMLGLPALVLSGLLLYLLRPHNYLQYRQADGRRALVLFRIRSRKFQHAFTQLLQRNLDTARDRAAREEDAPGRRGRKEQP